MNKIEKQLFGLTQDKQKVFKIILTNKNHVTATIINYGATLTSVSTPDADGVPGIISLGFNSLSDYEKDEKGTYIGATVGRFANRIKEGKFTLGRKKYQLAVNNGPNHLHGGLVGFNKKIWDFEIEEQEHASSVLLTLISPDGDEGYPGELTVHVKYTLNDDNELSIEYTATTDQDTILNLTNHSYWNLKGAGQGTIRNHSIYINADNYLPVDENLIPTGEVKSVKDTPFFFLNERKINDDIDKVGGYDHCFVLNHPNPKKRQVIHACTVFDSDSGRRMEIFTDQPGMQFYTGNYLTGISTETGIINPQEAFALETQNFPDAPNQKELAKLYQSPVLKAGKTYNTKTIFRFSIEPRKDY